MSHLAFRRKPGHPCSRGLVQRRLRSATTLGIAWAFSAASHAGACDVLKAEIEQKIRASGVASFSLLVTDLDAAVAGKVVGSCENGSKKIHYLPTAAPRSPGGTMTVSPGDFRPRSVNAGPAMLTECKPGFGGKDCRRLPPADAAASSPARQP